MDPDGRATGSAVTRDIGAGASPEHAIEGETLSLAARLSALRRVFVKGGPRVLAWLRKVAEPFLNTELDLAAVAACAN
jgi:hypothetical protein